MRAPAETSNILLIKHKKTQVGEHISHNIEIKITTLDPHLLWTVSVYRFVLMNIRIQRKDTLGPQYVILVGYV